MVFLMEAAMTTIRPTKVDGLSEIEATITLARAGGREVARKILSQRQV
jgi:hypothetical protein